MTPSGETLWQRWQQHANQFPSKEAIVHLQVAAAPRRWTWSELIAEARWIATKLDSLGVRRGDVCALILRHHPEFYAIYLGVSALGAIPSILAYPNARIHPDKFVQGLTGMARNSGLDWVLTERALEATVAPLVSGAHSSVRALLFPLEWTAGEVDHVFEPDEPNCDDPCLLQHSSGTTGLQKAVVLSHRAVLNHASRYAEAIGLSSSDKVVSWLPLYHDMGLIAAFHVPLACGIPTVQLDPFEWVSAPYLLLSALSQEKGTIAWLPNFAYNFMSDRVRDDEMDGIDLSSVRLLINCSEPIRAESHSKFIERFTPYHIGSQVLGASYAMAEATFAVTQTSPGERARELRVARDDLAQRRVVPADDGPTRTCVSSGRPILGCEIRIAHEHDQNLGECIVGEILIRSESLFDGYRNNPERTKDAFDDGWFKTGDLGFLWEGELFVTGRKKDLIIVAGRNICPEDVEDVVTSVQGVLPGRVVAFGTEDPATGTESVCVVAETLATEHDALKALRLEIVRAAMTIDVTVARVYIVPTRWLVKSSAGKLSRQANRDRVLAGELPETTRDP